MLCAYGLTLIVGVDLNFRLMSQKKHRNTTGILICKSTVTVKCRWKYIVAKCGWGRDKMVRFKVVE